MCVYVHTCGKFKLSCTVCSYIMYFVDPFIQMNVQMLPCLFSSVIHRGVTKTFQYGSHAYAYTCG